MALEKLGKIPSLVRKVGERASVGKPFYSPIDQAIANITQGTGTGQQMLAELLKTKGVAKELKDRPAIKKALEAAKDTKVTKADVERVAAENPTPQVQHRESDTTEYEQWQMPGGENRRNILLRLPNPAAERNAQIAAQIRDLYQGIGWSNQHMAKFPHLSVDEIPRIAHSEQEIARLRKELAALPRTPDMYEGGHFDEKNILAHARVADYYDKGKKILLIDEIQSDWHQTARDLRKKEVERLMESEGIDKATASKRVPQDFGYLKEGESPRLTGEPFQLSDGTYGVRWSDGTTADLGWGKAEAQRIATEGKQGEKLPDAPFKQNWHELVIKRLLDDAARNGYDKVVITPGADQARRYDLSTQISKIEYEPIGTSGQYEFVAFDKTGAPVIEEDEIPLSRIKELVGEGLAKKIKADEGTKVGGGGYRDWREIAGVDLNVGGEGMIGFYDQIVPSFLNDYGKKYGVTVGTHDLLVPRKNPLRRIQDAVDEGHITAEEVSAMNQPQRNAFMDQFQTRVNPVHSFDITPQMREEITTKGQPLYQVAPPVAIGAGAAMQEEEPTEYAGGGIIKKAAKALMSRAEQEANFAKFIAESKVPMRLYHGTIATEGGKREEAIRQMKPSKEGAFGSGVYLTPNSEYASTYTGIPARSQLERDMQTGSDYAKEHAAKLFARINRGEVKPHEVGGNMLPVFAQLKNPLVLGQDQKTFDKATDALIKLGVEQGKAEKMIERMWEDKGNIGKQIQSRAQAQGYDGLMVYQDGELSEIVSYNPNAIKSAIGNEGTYDITNPDMNKAGGGAVRKALKAVLPKGQQAILPAAESAANLERFLSKSQTANPVFHVAKTDVKQFSPQYRTELSSMGHHFGTSDQANFRSGQYDFNSQSPNIGKYHLSIQNPLEVSHMASFAPDHLADTMMELNLLKPEKYDALVGKHDYNPLKIGDDLVKILKKNGYDGLKYPNEREGEGFSYVPFDATQIKSAIGNRGTYDPAEADITKAKGGQVSNDAMWIALQNKQLRKKHGN